MAPMIGSNWTTRIGLPTATSSCIPATSWITSRDEGRSICLDNCPIKGILHDSNWYCLLQNVIFVSVITRIEHTCTDNEASSQIICCSVKNRMRNHWHPSVGTSLYLTCNHFICCPRIGLYYESNWMNNIDGPCCSSPDLTISKSFNFHIDFDLITHNDVIDCTLVRLNPCVC